jgi:hypothetical protein
LLARGGVEEQFAEEGVESGIEPADGPAIEGNRPRTAAKPR